MVQSCKALDDDVLPKGSEPSQEPAGSARHAAGTTRETGFHSAESHSVRSCCLFAALAGGLTALGGCSLTTSTDGLAEPSSASRADASGDRRVSADGPEGDVFLAGETSSDVAAAEEDYPDSFPPGDSQVEDIGRTDSLPQDVQQEETLEEDSRPGDVVAPDVPEEVGPVTWCSTLSPTPTFCDDFDRLNTPVSNGWDWVDTDPRSSGLLDTEIFVSSPASLTVLIPDSISSDRWFLLGKGFSTEFSRAQLDFSVYIEESVTACISQISLDGSPHDSYAAQVCVGKAWTISERYPNNPDGSENWQDTTFTPPPLNGWLQVSLILEIFPAGGGGKLTLKSGASGASVPQSVVHKPVTASNAYGKPTIGIGMPWVSLPLYDDWQVSIDNVAFYLQ